MGPKTITTFGIPAEHWSCEVCAGWNMIGSLIDATALDSLTTDGSPEPDPLQRNAFYRWNPTTKSYESVQTIVPGGGYWIASTTDCSVTLSLPST